MNRNAKVTIIGAGFAGLSAAAILARNGHEVTVIEKNEMAGGRARVWEKDGFIFDMGPSWYWMPDIFENYFSLFGKKPEDFYDLKRLNPSYRVYFGGACIIDMPSSLNELYDLFENLEPGSRKNLDLFLKQSEYKYKAGMSGYVFKPSHSFIEYLDPRLAMQGLKLQLLGNMRSHIHKLFKNEMIRKLLEFPVLFLGASPQNTPALYSLMNYADLVLGTWYPMGGMGKIVKAMERTALDEGVKFLFNTCVENIIIRHHQVAAIQTSKGELNTDFVIGNADYHHTDQKLLPAAYQNYTASYWDKRVLAPSCLIFYVGLNKKLKGLQHHNLFFDEDFDRHAHEIYTEAQWPEKPLFYVCCPSVSDETIAPENCENLFFLMPVAAGLKDCENEREKYFNLLTERFKALTGNDIKENILVKRSYAMDDFVKDYHAYKGNAYGLANTLCQTAFLKPKMKSKYLKNMLFTGQLTVPGPGVPPSIISGQIAAREALKILSKS